MDNDFYIRFENRFRGSRESIKDRVKIYLPIVEPLKTMYPDSPVIDVGCGRGEWLELLKEHGWQAVGVDTNSSMVELCRELGLNAVVGDAVEYLGTVESESVSMVSGFHIAEHLPFDLLVELVNEAHRVLLPGGILILETPNPENYRVGALTFYLDPTHHNPLPPPLIQFLAEDLGFSKSHILRLNGPNPPISPDISWTLFANPDYGLIAQKQKDSNMPEFGYLDSIQSEHVDFLTILNDSVNHYKNELNGVKNELNDVKGELNGVKNELNGVKNELNDVKGELHEIRGSYFWRITALLEKIADNDNVRVVVNILSRLFPLHTLPKRAILKITRLSKEGGHRIINKVKRLVYGTPPTMPYVQTTEEDIPMSSDVKRIHTDLVNNTKKTNNGNRNE
jgi:SAM-dependent methyltransferase